MSTERNFENLCEDYSPADAVVLDGKIATEMEAKIARCYRGLVEELEKGLKQTDPKDRTVYTGVAGLALLHLRISRNGDGKFTGEHLIRAETYITGALKHLDGRHISFLVGDPGVLVLAAIIFKHSGRLDEAKVCVTRLLSYQQKAVESSNRPQPDELLFGKSGFLHCLLVAHKEFGEELVPAAVVKDVFASIIHSGQHLAKQLKMTNETPLMFEWHNSYYLGAAHGLAGICLMLMEAFDIVSPDEPTRKLIEAAIDYCITLKYPSGNYPSSLGSTTDQLVHWCHGAPGFIHLFIKAYKVFGHQRYLIEAESCAHVIWHRGLLKKGYGICHGISGNAYAFLAMWQLTQDVKYLYRAVKFAEWLFEYGTHGCRTPDTPFSLFEGMAGSVYFLADLMMDPQVAQFPGYFGLHG